MTRVYRLVRCPRCGKPVPWVETQKLRPFCSERCRLIDLGDWITGKHAIPGESAEDENPLGSDTGEADPSPR
ncbi:MAG TPA: DNA gyrase inhibitor YacG [Methylococcus sp.]|nr:DNA gyrase inhibitor YacG [Methylococcus sp.]